MFNRLKRHVHAPIRGADEAVPPASLNDAYRMHRHEDIERFTKLAADAFPTFASRIRCFASDWVGRQFAIDGGRVVNGQEQILLLEPGSGEVYQIPVNIDDFLAREILEHPNEVVELAFLNEWLAAGGACPSYNECVGYKVPLFLNGVHELSNFEITDFDVYWTICGQLLAKIRDLPAGTSIGRVTFE